jgi:hypothetical protein
LPLFILFFADDHQRRDEVAEAYREWDDVEQM